MFIVGFLNFHFSNLGNYVGYDSELSVCATSKDGKRRLLSTRYGCSLHNCACNKSKTGVIFYPFDTRYKNIVLLMCEDCSKSPDVTGQTQHERLYDWYFRKYGTKKSFEFASGFAQEVNGFLKYNSSTLNLHKTYGTGERSMNDFEQKILRHVVMHKLDNYQVGSTPCTGKFFSYLVNVPLKFKSFI